VSCNRDCGGGCPLIARVEGGRVVRISNNPAGSSWRMSGCPCGFSMPRILYAPDRLKRPLVRTGPRGSDSFRETSWDEALSIVADRLSDVVSRHGPESILDMGGSGSSRGAVHNTSVLPLRFLQGLGGGTTTRGSYSSEALNYVKPLLFGSAFPGIDAATLQFSDLIVLWGANVADTRFAADLENRIRERRRQGVRVVSVEPRRSRTAERLADEWIPVLPGTDTALMMAVLHVLLEDGLADRDFVARCTTGFEELERYVRGSGSEPAKTPEWAETVCGTPSPTIRAFARRYGATRPAALIPGPSIQRTVGGEEAARMAITLQVATGNVGRKGGSNGVIWGRLPHPRCGRMAGARAPSRRSIPILRWPDAILQGTAGGYPADIAAVYSAGGNELAQGSDCRKSAEAYHRLEFSVCHDLFLTPTARHCDVVLPATTFLERNDVVFPPGNYLLWSARAVPPLHESRTDYDILRELADRMGFGTAFSEGRSADEWLDCCLVHSEVEDVEAFKNTGLYMGKDQTRVGLSEFVANPENHPLDTPSGRIEIASEAYARTGFPAIPTCRVLAPSRDYPLRLFTPHARHRIHSQGSQIEWFLEKEPHVLWIHPSDASARGIGDGEPVEVSSERGRTRIPARVTEDVMPGAVCLLEGAWPRFDADGADTAGAANVLTSTEPTLPSEGSRTHSVNVQVARRR
jgi:anaerobic dimethyl sulfoxide reductase subunit A